MTLTTLWAQDFRNFAELEIECSPGINLILGRNGAGKTNLLESIHFLGRTRSFRTHQSEKLVRDGKSSCAVRGTMVRNGGAPTVVSVQRDRKGVRIRHAERTVKSLAELAPWLPIQVIGPESHELLQGGPQFRRRYLDWGVFHVEQSFYASWQRYTRALRQRNAALRKGVDQHQINAWNREMLETAGEIDAFRKVYLQHLLEPVQSVANELLGLEKLGLDYRAGWPKGEPLEEVLERSLPGDRERGFTRYGPHRADLAVSIDGRSIRDRVSRGQQKLLVISLLLAQAQTYSAAAGNPSLLLIDDLAAELDEEHRRRVLGILENSEAQVFLTALEQQSWAINKNTASTVFHVEHGRVSKMVY